MTLDELKKKNVSAISLGCDKNRVDLEKMIYNIKDFGFNIVQDIEDAEIIIVNTCAFIKSAIEEAIQNIFASVGLKKVRCEKVIVTGCMVSRFKNDVNLIEGIDAVLDLKDNDKIVETILKLYGIDGHVEYKEGRILTNLPHYAYLKISDGCDNGCAYCTIPRIRGRYKSVPMEDIIKEAKNLAKQGVKELILIAQDTTRYGYDLYNEYKLVPLIKELSKIKTVKWIRLHYCYPEMVSDELLNEIASNPKVCKYIDIPLQHIDNDVLKNMNRRSSEQDVRDLIDKLKNKYPEISIRSTFIVGFPGETKKQFNKLLKFLEDARLSHAGFFKFSKEDRTKAYFMKHQIWEFVKNRRLKKAQSVQEKIMNAININKIGDEREVIVDFYDEETKSYCARLPEDSPEVDFMVAIETSKELKPGNFYRVKITNYFMGLYIAEVLEDESTK